MKKFFLTLTLPAFILIQAYCQFDPVTEADNLILNSKFQEAVDLVDHTLRTEHNLSAVIVLENKKAQALTAMSEFNQAQKILTRAEKQLTESPDAFLAAITQSNLGFLLLNQGLNEAATQSLQTALLRFEKAGKQNSLEAAQNLSYLGLAYMNTGKYAQAEEQLQIALAMRKEKLGDSHELIAATYNDLGLVYSQLDKDKALDYFEMAIALYSKLYGPEHIKIANTKINTGVIYRDLELYGDAVDNFETALKTWEKVYPHPHAAKAIALYNLGQTYLKMGYHKGALGYYEQALSMYESTYGKKHPEVANVLNAIGNLQLSQQRYDEALNTYQKALQANVPDFTSNAIEENPRLTKYYHGTRLLQSLVFKAEALEAKYLEKSLKFSELQHALTILHLCDSLIDKLRRESSSESDKLLIGITANEVYANGVRIAHEAGLNALKKRPYFEDAFYFAEKSKSAVLLEAISDANAKSFAGIPDKLLDEEKRLKSAITLCAQKLSQKPSPEEEQQLRQEAFELNRSYNTFVKELEMNFPGYYDLKYNQAAPSIREIQPALDNETLLLSYFLDEEYHQLYIFMISRNTFHIENKTLIPDLNKKITGLRNSLYYGETTLYKQLGRELYKLLIPSESSRFNKLIILPIGRLSIIPFETLLTENVKEDISDYSRLPYLLNTKSIRYEFSAGLLMQKAKDHTASTQPSILLCAPVSFEKNKLPDLPGSEMEVNSIHELFKVKKLPAALLSKSNATERAFKSSDLKQYTLLHLATHGVVDENNPELSKIFLQPEPGMEDGSLFTGEIYNLELAANLVILSACETGLGKISKGEGVIGLSRALVYAGAKNIVVSFWSVADESTSDMMKDFYRLLLESPGTHYSDCLQMAKKKMIEGEKFSAPYYWAPFILIGF